MIALALTAWVALSFPAGLLIAACIPPLHDDRQHTLHQRGEGKVREGGVSHIGLIKSGSDQDHA